MILRAYKYRIYPTKGQKLLLAKHFGCSRFIYNYGLEQKIKSYKETGKAISRYAIQSLLPKLKANDSTKWLNDVNSQTLQSALKQLENAFKHFYIKHNKFPRFKSKHAGKQSFQIPQNVKIDFSNGRLTLPKFSDTITCHYTRQFTGKIKTCTITKTPTNKYFIAILVEENGELPIRKPIDENKAIGIDLGIKTFATLSNGIEIKNPKYMRKTIKRLKHISRSLSRKQMGSARRNKTRLLLAKLYEKVTNQRTDFLHKTTKWLVDNYDTICLETLKPKNMAKNPYLALDIYDLSIGEFNHLIEYKSKWAGKNVIHIGQYEPSSKMCSCGYTNHNLTLSERNWKCPSCGITNNRDLLAAKNIKRFALEHHNTVRTSEIYAKDNMNPRLSSTLEAITSISA